MFGYTKAESPDDGKLAFEHAKLAVSEFGGWIKNADAKVTILAASTGVVVTLVASRLPNLIDLALGDRPWLRIVATVSAVIFALSVIATFRFIFAALMPRTASPGPANPFAWPSVARLATADDPSFQTASTPQAWAQAFQLAKIAKAKYAAFSSALRCFFVTLASAGFIVVVVALA